MTNFFYLVRCLHPQSTLFPYTTLFRSDACHKGAATSQFQTMSTACSSCHVADFQAAKSPNHVAANFPTTCDSCHGTDNWLNAKFDHGSVGFPLTAGHAVPPRQCADCHINNNYNL